MYFPIVIFLFPFQLSVFETNRLHQKHLASITGKVFSSLSLLDANDRSDLQTQIKPVTLFFDSITLRFLHPLYPTVSRLQNQFISGFQICLVKFSLQLCKIRYLINKEVDLSHINAWIHSFQSSNTIGVHRRSQEVKVINFLIILLECRSRKPKHSGIQFIFIFQNSLHDLFISLWKETAATVIYRST